MKNALILHGTDFSLDHRDRLSLANWFPWLKNELEKLGYQVTVPDLPEPWHPDLERYWDYLKSYDFNEDTIIIGHSSGGAAVLGILDKLPREKKIRLAVSVAGFYKDEDWNCKGLFPHPFDWVKIKNQSKKIEIIFSDDDPYVKPYHAEYFSTKLNIKPILMPGKKHFNLEASENMRQFSELLELIKKI